MDIDWKLCCGLLAALISASNMVYYISETIKGKVKPHAYSWLIWALTALVAFIGQLEGNAGYSTIFTGWMVISCSMITIIGLIKFRAVIKHKDIIYLILCGFALVLMPFVGTALYSVIIICIVDAMGVLPTIQKSWNDPYNEKAISFSLFVVTNMLSFLAIDQYNFLSVAFPATVMTACACVVVLLILRRHILKTPA